MPSQRKNFLHNMHDQIIRLTKELISIPSYKGETKSLLHILERSLQELQDFTIERFTHKFTPSALIYHGLKRPKRFNVLFNAHLDVIPGTTSQFNPYEKNGKLIGRGAYDMKAAAAVMIAVLKIVAHEVDYSLGLQLVTDEEIGGFNGTKYQIEQKVDADCVIAGECGTNLDVISLASKGFIWMNIVFRGTSAHGAHLWLGDNAVWQAQEFLHKLKKLYPVPSKEQWITTINIASITTPNTTFNKVPDMCSVLLDIRCIPADQKHIEQRIRALLPVSAIAEIVMHEKGYATNKDNKYVQKLSGAIKHVIYRQPNIKKSHGASDLRHFYNAAVIEYGPTGGGQHTDNEWVDIESLETYFNILLDFCKSL